MNTRLASVHERAVMTKMRSVARRAVKRARAERKANAKANVTSPAAGVTPGLEKKKPLPKGK
jgi:hypothetical protein